MAHFLKAFARTWATRELRGLSAVWLVAFAPALTAWRDLPAQTAPAQEYQLKAVFLFNFAQFVEWPPQAFPDRQVPLEEIKSCHVLFISRSESDRLGEILAGLKGRNILTVSDADGFAQHGGMIRFVTEKNKIRLRINLDAAKAANLTISSKLLRPAEIVGPGGE